LGRCCATPAPQLVVEEADHEPQARPQLVHQERRLDVAAVVLVEEGYGVGLGDARPGECGVVGPRGLQDADMVHGGDPRPVRGRGGRQDHRHVALVPGAQRERDPVGQRPVAADDEPTAPRVLRDGHGPEDSGRSGVAGADRPTGRTAEARRDGVPTGLGPHPALHLRLRLYLIRLSLRFRFGRAPRSSALTLRFTSGSGGI
jgi:hypothetical protein